MCHKNVAVRVGQQIDLCQHLAVQLRGKAGCPKYPPGQGEWTQGQGCRELWNAARGRFALLQRTLGWGEGQDTANLPVATSQSSLYPRHHEPAPCSIPEFSASLTLTLCHLPHPRVLYNPGTMTLPLVTSQSSLYPLRRANLPLAPAESSLYPWQHQPAACCIPDFSASLAV